MMQWMNLHWNNSFVNRTQLSLLCEKSGAILLVLVEILIDLKILKFSTDRINRIFAAFNKVTVYYQYISVGVLG